MTRFLILLLAVCGATVARADAPHASAASQLVPDQAALTERRERRLGEKLTRLVGALPEVQLAQAEVTLSEPSRALIDDALPPPRVSLVLQVRRVLEEQTLTDLVRKAAPQLQAASVTVVQTKAAVAEVTPDALRNVGPFRVASGSDAPLRATLALLLVSNVLLAAFLLARRKRGNGCVL